MVIMGKHFVPTGFNVKSYEETLNYAETTFKCECVYFMPGATMTVQAVSLKFLFGAKIKIVYKHRPTLPKLDNVGLLGIPMV